MLTDPYCRFRTLADDPEWDRLIGYPVYDRRYPGYPAYQPDARRPYTKAVRPGTLLEQILAWIAAQDGGFTVADIARAVGHDYKTVHNIMCTVRRRGVVQRVAGGASRFDPIVFQKVPLEVQP